MTRSSARRIRTRWPDHWIAPRAGLLALLSLMPAVLLAQQDVEPDGSKPTSLPTAVPDLREEEAPLKVQSGDFVVVPIPISNPTFDTGLILGAAYFYGQTEEQEKVQPPTLTGGPGAYTSNGSYAVALGQQSYWDENRWRLEAAAGYVDFSLTLNTPDDSEGQTNWGIKGALLLSTVSRRLWDSHWYGGVIAR